MIAIRVGCYLASAVALGGAGAYLLLGRDKGLGIFLVLVAAVLCRVLVINIAGAIEDAAERRRRL